MSHSENALFQSICLIFKTLFKRVDSFLMILRSTSSLFTAGVLLEWVGLTTS